MFCARAITWAARSRASAACCGSPVTRATMNWNRELRHSLSSRENLFERRRFPNRLLPFDFLNAAQKLQDSTKHF
jgi:hypothetical protein